MAIDPASDAGCVTLPANTSASDSAEYLLVAQSTGGVPGDTASFQLESATLTALLARLSPPRESRARARLGSRGTVARRFDRLLRGLVPAHPSLAGSVRASPRGAVARTISPPTLHSVRTFSVCATLDCNPMNGFDMVTARVQSVGAHVAIYVDTLAPAGGLDSAQLDSLTQVFNTHVYTVDTVAFGGPSDIDSNGVVIALMTPVVNRLVNAAECSSGGYVAGFVFPYDLFPGQGYPSNNGEIFYTIVADPSATLSCAHTAGSVDSTLPTTFLHEFQHLISLNQHILVRGGQQESLWLDESLSSLAEELGGQSFLPDSATWGVYVAGDVYDAYQYLLAPDQHFLLQASDTVLADFGAGWLYLRYLVDQFGSGITLKLEETTDTGPPNVAAQTGLPFDSTAVRWALANWVSDLPGFAPPAVLQYKTWSFRPIFASLNAQDPADFPYAFPLIPATGGATNIDLAGYLHAGSGAYARVLQAPQGASVTLRLTVALGALGPSLVPRLAIVRIR